YIVLHVAGVSPGHCRRGDAGDQPHPGVIPEAHEGLERKSLDRGPQPRRHNLLRHHGQPTERRRRRRRRRSPRARGREGQRPCRNPRPRSQERRQ
ncbi:unnamed protein product, partial [Ectocarpus sp. 8 AP-2014]